MCWFLRHCSYIEHNFWSNKNPHEATCSVKAVPSQAWSGSGGSRKLRFPDFMTTAQDGGKIFSVTHLSPLPQEMLLVLISVRVLVDPRAIVRSEGFYVNEKFQWQQLVSNQRLSDLQHSTLTTVPPRSPTCSVLNEMSLTEEELKKKSVKQILSHCCRGVRTRGMCVRLHDYQ